MFNDWILAGICLGSVVVSGGCLAWSLAIRAQINRRFDVRVNHLQLVSSKEIDLPVNQSDPIRFLEPVSLRLTEPERIVLYDLIRFKMGELKDMRVGCHAELIQMQAVKSICHELAEKLKA